MLIIIHKYEYLFLILTRSINKSTSQNNKLNKYIFVAYNLIVVLSKFFFFSYTLNLIHINIPT